MVIVIIAVVATSRLVYRNLFACEIKGFGHDLSQWQSFGGSWELQGGTVTNDSDERGAKLITGTPFASDYMVEADVTVLGNYGDAGLIVRAQDVGRGVDSYRGFFAGLRTLDNALLFGRADYGWDEYKKSAIPGNIEVGRYYHLRLIAVGCAIAARVDLPGGRSIREGVTQKHCVTRGRVGLKSFQSPGAWRNFRVTRATRRDLEALMSGTHLGSAQNGTLHSADPKFDERNQIRKEALSRRLEAPITQISDLSLLPSLESFKVSVHGVVTLKQPVTFVEDATGGVAVSSTDAPAIAIGDEVEATGTIKRDSKQMYMLDAHIRPLWSSTVTTPPMITAEEAATGSKDGQLVVLSGRLLSVEPQPRGAQILRLESHDEVYRAYVGAGHHRPITDQLRVGSDLQVVGVVTSEGRFAGDSAFGLLVSPNEGSLQVVRLQSWWTPFRATAVSFCTVLVLIAAVILVHRIREEHILRASLERQMLAHDLHDTVSQGLAGIGFQLTSASTHLYRPELARQQIERAKEMVRENHEELRRSISCLRDEIAALDNLAEALRGTALKMIGNGPMTVSVISHGGIERLPLHVADCFYRIGQEAISNTVLHSEASSLVLQLAKRGRVLILTVSDDGRGIPEQKTQTGFGLYGMERRAEMIGAKLSVRSTSQGTTVLVEKAVPHRLGWGMFTKPFCDGTHRRPYGR